MSHNKIWGGHPAVTTGDDRSRGQRAADAMKAALATWTALFAVLAGIALWITSGGMGADRAPFILLNLVLSCFASLQCFVLLIAGKRGEQIAAEIAQHTLENTQALEQLLEVNNRLTDEVHKHVVGS